MSPPEFAIASERLGTSIVIQVIGEIDVATVGELREALNDAASEVNGRIVLDMSATEFIESTGLGALLEAHHRAQSEGYELIVICDSEEPLKAMRLTGLTDLLTVVPARDFLHGNGDA
jgi:anti-sigma B factor antagonist